MLSLIVSSSRVSVFLLFLLLHSPPFRDVVVVVAVRRCDRPARRAQRQGDGAHVLVGVQKVSFFHELVLVVACLPVRCKRALDMGSSSMLWQYCRSYRNGFVWHDLADDDYIYPVAGREYVLKGTERLHPIQLPLLDAAAASSCSSGSQETATSSPPGWENGTGEARQKKGAGINTSELCEYRVYKAEDPAAAAADAATQTEDGYRSSRGRHAQRAAAAAAQEELSREETSPPTASTSPETLEALIKADGRVMAAVTGGGRTRASSVLMQLISCGSVSVKSTLASPVMARTAAHYRPRPPRPPTLASTTTEIPNYRQKIVEDKEYFSGSLVETKRSSPADTSQDIAVLRRSSSYNADRYTNPSIAG